MNSRVVVAMGLWALGMGAPGRAQTAGTKVGIINIQDAIIRSEEGQKTAKILQDKYAPRQAELQTKRRDLEDLQAQLSKGRNTMSDEARNNLIRQIDLKNKSLTRDNEDATAEFQQEESKLINTIGQKMMAVIDKYAKEKGYSIILDISSPQSPVLYAVNTVDITTEIVGLYDKGLGSGGTAASAPAPAAPAPITRPPAARPPVKSPIPAPPPRP